MLRLPEQPLIGFTIEINMVTLQALLLELGDALPAAAPQKSGIHSVPLSEAMFCAAERLIDLMDNPLHAKVLGPQTVREMLFHALTEGVAPPCRRSPIATTMWARSPGCCV